MDAAFEVHRLNSEGIEKAKQLAAAFDNLLQQINQIVPVSGRELSICYTKLEEASFFAKKAMAKLGVNQE